VLGKAIATIHGAIAPGQEWDLGLLAAVGADGRMHLARRPNLSAIAFCLAGLTAVRAAFGLAVALAREELLVIRGEGERLTTVLTVKGFVGVRHATTSFYVLFQVVDAEVSQQARTRNSVGSV